MKLSGWQGVVNGSLFICSWIGRDLGVLPLNEEDNSNCKGVRGNSKRVEGRVVMGEGGADFPKGLDAEPLQWAAGHTRSSVSSGSSQNLRQA